MTMTVAQFVAKGFEDHVTDAGAVMSRLPEGVDLVAAPGDLPVLASLVVHVAGEHLGRWEEGLALLERMRAHSCFDASCTEGKAVNRSLAILLHCAGDGEASERHALLARTGGDVPEASDRARILAVVATTLAGQKRTREAAQALGEALRLASYGPGPLDPAARALAVAGNNLAGDLERREELDEEERALIVKAAEAGREYWGIVGGWMEVERAEYRLAMSCLKAGLPERASRHASECHRIVCENGSDAGELFYANEARARACLASKDRDGAARAVAEAERLLPTIADEGFRAACATDLKRLEADMA